MAITSKVRRTAAAVVSALLAVPAIAIVTAGPVGGSAFPGSNGKIAFTRGDEIFVMNPDGTGQTNLTNDSDADRQPDWSADGEKIAFSTNGDGNFEIYVMNADGSNKTRITINADDDTDPTWSPDGDKIAFTSFRTGTAQIFVMDADGTNQTQLTSTVAGNARPTWSPDGERIAFNSLRDGNFEIYKMDDDGSDQTRLTTDPEDDFDPCWSPDGDKILFTADRVGGEDEIFVMRSDGTGQKNLTNTPGSDGRGCFSPDGERIAFTSDRAIPPSIYVMDADGSAQTRVTTGPGIDVEPNWQPLDVTGDITVTKAVVGTVQPGTTFQVKVDCDGEQDDKTLTFGETGGTQSFHRETFGPLECDVTEPQTGGAGSVDITCAAGQNAECTDHDSFTLFDDPSDDGSDVQIGVTNWFPVSAEPTFTG